MGDANLQQQLRAAFRALCKGNNSVQNPGVRKRLHPPSARICRCAPPPCLAAAATVIWLTLPVGWTPQSRPKMNSTRAWQACKKTSSDRQTDTVVCRRSRAQCCPSHWRRACRSLVLYPACRSSASVTRRPAACAASSRDASAAKRARPALRRSGEGKRWAKGGAPHDSPVCSCTCKQDDNAPQLVSGRVHSN